MKMILLGLVSLLSLSSVTVDRNLPAPPKPEVSKTEKLINDRREDFLLRVQVLADKMAEERKGTAGVPKIYFATLNVTDKQDAVYVLFTYFPNGETEGLLFLFTGQKWEVFPDVFKAN